MSHACAHLSSSGNQICDLTVLRLLQHFADVHPLGFLKDSIQLFMFILPTCVHLHIKKHFVLLFPTLGERLIFTVYVKLGPPGSNITLHSLFARMSLCMPYAYVLAALGICSPWPVNKTAPFSPPSNSTG